MKPATFRPLDRLTTISIGGVLTCCLAPLLLAVLPLESTSDDVDLVVIGCLGAIVVVGLTTVVAFLMWMSRAASNLRAFYPGAAFKFTPGWAVGWWFVPFAQLVMPRRVMAEISRASAAAARGEHVDVASDDERASLLTLWWTFWVCMTIFERLSARLPSNTSVDVTGAVLTGLAGMFCIKLLRDISEDQAMAGARLQSARIDTTAHVAERHD